MTLRVEDLMPILGVGRNTAYAIVKSNESVASGSGHSIAFPGKLLLNILLVPTLQLNPKGDGRTPSPSIQKLVYYGGKHHVKEK